MRDLPRGAPDGLAPLGQTAMQKPRLPQQVLTTQAAFGPHWFEVVQKVEPLQTPPWQV